MYNYACPNCGEDFKESSNQTIPCPHCNTLLDLDWDADFDGMYGTCTIAKPLSWDQQVDDFIKNGEIWQADYSEYRVIKQEFKNITMCFLINKYWVRDGQKRINEDYLDTPKKEKPAISSYKLEFLDFSNKEQKN